MVCIWFSWNHARMRAFKRQLCFRAFGMEPLPIVLWHYSSWASYLAEHFHEWRSVEMGGAKGWHCCLLVSSNIILHFVPRLQQLLGTTWLQELTCTEAQNLNAVGSYTVTESPQVFWLIKYTPQPLALFSRAAVAHKVYTIDSLL